MILETSSVGPSAPSTTWGRATLDAILRKNAKDHPDRVALVDDPERNKWNGVPPQVLTYADAERQVERLAGLFGSLGLRADAMVALDAPPCVDAVLILLAAFRAGLIVVPVPALWSRKECVAFLSPVAPQGIILTTVALGESRGERMRDVGSALRSVEVIFGYGGNLPREVQDLGTALATAEEAPAPHLSRDGDPGDHVVTVTVGPGTEASPILHVRSHRHWLASGLALVLEARLREGASILLPYALSGLTGIGAGLVPWLLTAGTLHLHHFDGVRRLVGRAAACEPNFVVLPGPLLDVYARAERTAGRESLVGAVWKDRHPETASATEPGQRSVIDITAIDELAFVARRRLATGIDPLPIGPVRVPSDGNSGTALLETRIEGQIQKASGPHVLGGLLSLRGPAVTTIRSLPVPGNEPAPTGIQAGFDAFVRTGVQCRLVDGPTRGAIPIGRVETDRPAGDDAADVVPPSEIRRAAG